MSNIELRKIVVILFADIQGYTALMQQDEVAALSQISKFEHEISTNVQTYNGQIISFYGDGCLVTFETTKSALECAIQLQYSFQKDPIVSVRIGLHMGEVVFKKSNIFGDNVNIASRIESMGTPGAVLISKAIQQQISNNPDFPTKKLGSYHFKNIKTPIPVYALSVENLVVPSAPADSAKLRKLPKKRYFGILLLCLGLLSGYLWSNYLSGNSSFLSNSKEVEQKKISLSILPFELRNINASHFLGLEEDILAQLSNIKALKVTAYNSSKRYLGSDKPDQVIAEELNSRHLLQGSVRKIDNKFRINITLVDTKNNASLWGLLLNKSPSELHNIHTDIINGIIDALDIQLQPELTKRLNKTPTNYKNAYDLYKKARAAWKYRDSKDSILIAISLLKKAIEIDPNFALGYAGLSQAYYMHAGYVVTDRQNNIRKMKLNAQKAIELDSNMAEAYLGLAKYYELRDGEVDRKKAIEYYIKAISLKPNYAMAHHWLGYLYNYLGKRKLAYEHLKAAHDLDPFSPPILVMHAESTSKLGLEKQGEDLFLTGMAEYPNERYFPSLFIEHYLFHKRWDKSLALCNQLPPGIGRLTNQIKVIAYSGQVKKARAMYEAIDTTKYNSKVKLENWAISPDKLNSHLLEMEGRIDEVFAIFEKAVHNKDGWIMNVLRFPYTDKVTQDPRFKPLMEQAGLSVDK